MFADQWVTNESYTMPLRNIFLLFMRKSSVWKLRKLLYIVCTTKCKHLVKFWEKIVDALVYFFLHFFFGFRQIGSIMLNLSFFFDFLKLFSETKLSLKKHGENERRTKRFSIDIPKTWISCVFIIIRSNFFYSFFFRVYINGEFYEKSKEYKNVFSRQRCCTRNSNV